MKYGIEYKVKAGERGWWAERRRNWKVLKWYERKKDRDKALEIFLHRSNGSGYQKIYEYRSIDADKPAKKRKRAKVIYPEFDLPFNYDGAVTKGCGG